MRQAHVLCWAAVAGGLLILPAGLRAGGGDEAKKLFDAMEKLLVEAKTLQVTADSTFKTPKGEGGMKVTMALAQGNKGKSDITFTFGEKKNEVTVVSNGIKTVQGLKGKAAEETDTKTHMNEDLVYALTRIGLLHTLFQVKKADDDRRPKDILGASGFKLGKKEEVGGRQAQAIQYEVVVEGVKRKVPTTLWIDSETGLPVLRTVSGPVEITERYQIRLNEPIPDERFALPKVKGE